MRGQRVVWAMVNTLLLTEARSRGFGIYRNVMRRVGYGLEGGGVLTKARLREMLNNEDQARVLVSVDECGSRCKVNAYAVGL